MSVFDFNSVSAIIYKGEVPNLDWVNVPIGDYVAQINNLDGRENQNRTVEGTTIWCDVSWEILDDEARKATNMEHPTVVQSFSLQFVRDNSGNRTTQLDLGPNQNMSLKNLWKACGVLTNATLNKLRNQTAYIHVNHRAMKDAEGNHILDSEGKPQFRAEVTRVTSLEQARASQRQAALAAQ